MVKGDELMQKCDDSKTGVAISTVFGVAIGAIPIVGPFLSALDNGLSFRKVHERLNILSEKLEQLQVNEIDKAFFETDEGYDFLRTTLFCVAQSRSEDKIERFAKIAKGVIKDDVLSVSEGETYISIVNEANDEEIVLLSALYNKGLIKGINPNPEAEDSDFNSVFIETNIVSYKKDFIMKRLERLGTLKMDTMLIGGGVIYSFTEMGVKFIQFLNHR